MYQEEVFSCRKTDRHTQGNILFQAFEGKKSKIKRRVEHLVFMSRLVQIIDTLVQWPFRNVYK